MGTSWDMSEAAGDGSSTWGEGWKPKLLFARALHAVASPQRRPPEWSPSSALQFGGEKILFGVFQHRNLHSVLNCLRNWVGQSFASRKAGGKRVVWI